MNQIDTLEELVESLENAAPQDHPKIMKRIRIEAHQLESFATWTKNGYTRNCLARTDQYELILLCWEVGAKTPIHGHDGEECWVFQFQGSVEEKRYSQENGHLQETDRMLLTPGRLTYMHDKMGYHRMENLSNNRAMTLHLYTSPIDRCKVYNDQEECFETLEMFYHTFQGNELDSQVS